MVQSHQFPTRHWQTGPGISESAGVACIGTILKIGV